MRLALPRWMRFAKEPAPELNGELTRAQVIATRGNGKELSRPKQTLYDTYRQMRKHPTLAMVRAFVRAPIMSSEWLFEEGEDAPPGAVDFIRDQLEGLRQHIIRHAINGTVDFGWQPFELVFEQDEGEMIVARKIKPLLQDLTEIVVDETTGAFAGLKQRARGTILDVELEPERCLVFAPEVEGTDWYGQPLLENARETWTQWVEANTGAARYDQKIAGSHWVIYYPVGRTVYNGTETDNAEIARDILGSLESSGSVCMPSIVRRDLDRLNATTANESEWRVETLSDATPRQPSFIDRLSYLDKLMARALLMPERAAMEGQFGTKAEAGVHADLALTQRQLDHEYICQVLNWHLIDRLLAWNYGDEYRGTVYVKPAPLVDAKLALFRQVYTSILSNPASAIEELGRIDLDAMREALGIPARPVDALNAEGMDVAGEMADAMRGLYEAVNPTEDEQADTPEDEAAA